MMQAGAPTSEEAAGLGILAIARDPAAFERKLAEYTAAREAADTARAELKAEREAIAAERVKADGEVRELRAEVRRYGAGIEAQAKTTAENIIKAAKDEAQRLKGEAMADRVKARDEERAAYTTLEEADRFRKAAADIAAAAEADRESLLVKLAAADEAKARADARLARIIAANKEG